MQRLKILINQNLYCEALKASIPLPNPNLLNTIYAIFIKSCTPLNPFLSASLITDFSLCGDFSRATHLLRLTHRPDTAVFNSLISGYARFGRSKPAFQLFNELRQLGLQPDAFSSSSLVKSCEDLQENEVLHGVFVKMGLSSGGFLVSGLIENYSRFGFVESGKKCFDECLVLDSVVWTAMINGYVRNCEFEKGRGVFMEMKRLGFKMNEFSLSSVLGAVFSVGEGEQIHGYCVKIGFLCGFSAYLNNALMSMYCRLGCGDGAVKVFDEMPDPDIVSWTGLISAACDGVEAVEIFRCCMSRGFEVNQYTLITVLSVIEGPNMLETGKQIHALCFKDGYLVLSSVCNALISMYTKFGQMPDARRSFDEIVHRDSVSWNALISGYSENHLPEQAIQMFSQMRHSLIMPNEYNLASILEVMSDSNSPKQVMQVHSLVTKLGFVANNFMLSCLIMAYGKCRGIDESKTLFNEDDEMAVIHFNAMARALDHHGDYSDIQFLFITRWNLCLEVDSISFSLVLKACSVLTDLHQGRSIHSLAIKSGVSADKFVESAVIDVYSKCGSINDAEKAFGKNTSRYNLAAWNAMIMGYAQFGWYNKVHDLFTKMPEFGMKPDEITYLGVLNSCCHAGLVGEAHYHLASMSSIHDLIPCLEHYALVVDVLGRVGLLEDAKRTIDQMPISPDARIWQILLSACHIHGNVDLGIIAATKLLELQPENDSAFVLLSNLYANAGMWHYVRELRRKMKETVPFKEPGSSWIQVKESIHYFFAGDASHPESEDIFMKLTALMKQMVEIPEEEQAVISS